MKNRFNRQLDMLVKVNAFHEAHSELFPVESLPGKLFTTVAESIPSLRKYSGSQIAGMALTREGVAAKSEAREALLNRLVAINRTARSIDHEQSGVFEKFRLPETPSDNTLVALARGFVENAGPLAAKFVEYEMPQSFIEDLKTAIGQFEAAIKTRVQKKGMQISATASIDSIMETAMDAVYRLDGIVPNKLGENELLLREWEAARHVAWARSSKSEEQEPSPPADTPVPAA